MGKIFYASLLALSVFGISSMQAGPKGLGMGNIGTVYPIDDSTAGFYNPAVMAVVPDRFDLCAGLYNHNGHTKIHGNLVPSLNDDFNAVHTRNWPFVYGGVNKHFCLDFCRNYDMAVGFFVAPINPLFKTTFKKPFPLLGTTKFGTEVIQYLSGLTLAINLTECHAIGVSWNVGMQRLKFNGYQNIANPILSIHPHHVTNKGYNYSVGTGFSIGWRSQFSDKLMVGAKFQSRTYMTRLHKYEGLIADKGHLDYPWNASFGVALKPTCCSTIVFDVEYYQTRGIRELKNSDQPANPLVDKFGTKEGPGKGYRNVWRYHWGADYTWCDFTGRIGWIYHKTPVRRSQTLANCDTLDLMENLLTIGGTWQIDSSWDLTFFYLHGFQKKVKGKNSIPLTSGGGECDIKLREDVFGLSVGRYF